MRRNRLLDYWKRQSIRNQIFLSMLMITILATVIQANMAYRSATDAIESNYRASYEATLRNSSKVLNMRLKVIIEEGRGFLNEPKLRQVLKNSGQYGGSKFSTGDQNSLKEVASNLTDFQACVNAVVFIDLYGHCYKVSNINKGTYDFYQYYEDHSVLEEEWVTKAVEARGREIFFGEDILGPGEDLGFSMAKYLINPSTAEPMGYLVINLSKQLLADSFVLNNQSGSYMIVEEKDGGQPIYFRGDADEIAQIMEEYPNRELSEKYVFSSVKNNTTGWNVVNVITRNELSRESRGIRLTVWIWGFAIILLCFILAKLISANITRPLKQLETIISRVGEGERHITEDFDDSEVGKIGQKFKEMVNTNLELSEHLMELKLNEREAEILLLQSQINPHFLYNTLDALYCLAIMHGDDQMAEMVMALSDNFKLALNNGEKYITVADSIKRVEEYMKLQNMRYHDRFQLIVEVEPEILPRKTISFILQPFVENAMYHGLEPKLGNGKIWLRGWREGGDLTFVVEDDGVGIDDMSRLEKGYGILNVRERIRMNYGETYGIQVESQRGKGTRITIVVPIEE